MVKEVLVPDIGDYKDVDIIEVAVKAGDTVQFEETLITLETDKATMDIPSPFAGKISKMHVKVGDKVYFHVTNLEQDYDVPHGIGVIGANTSEMLIMPGQTETFIWEPKQAGVWPFYCTDFCSALHQEMQGYVRVSPKGSNVPITWTLDGETPK